MHLGISLECALNIVAVHVPTKKLPIRLTLITVF